MQNEGGYNQGKVKKNLTLALYFFLLLFFISIILLASVPPVSRDALTHHLAVPKLYLNHGSIYEIPFMVSSYYPMNLDLLYLIPLYFGNDIFPKIIHFVFGILTALLIYIYLKNRIGQVYALGGALFFLSIPIVVKLSASVYVDLGLVFFSTTSLFLLLKWNQNINRPIFLFLSAVCCGLSMGTKYNGLIGYIIFLAFVPIVYVRHNQTKKPDQIKAIGYAIIYGITSLAVFSPWLIQNYIWKNNPIFPLYDSWFNPGSEVPKSLLTVFTTRQIIYDETWWEMALLPIRIFFQGQDGNPQYFDGKLNPFLLILPLFSFYNAKREANVLKFEKIFLIVFILLFFSFSFLSTDLRIRYILPVVPPLVILSVYGVKNITNWLQSINKTSNHQLVNLSVGIIVSIAFLLNAIYICQQFNVVKPFEYLSGKITRDQYIEKFRAEYPSMQFINRNVQADAKVLFFYIGNRGYYCDREYVFDMVNYKSTLHQMVKKTDYPTTVCRSLQQKGISHFLIRNDIFNRWVSEDFSEKEKDILKRFFRKYVKKLYSKNGYSVFELSVVN